MHFASAQGLQRCDFGRKCSIFHIVTFLSEKRASTQIRPAAVGAAVVHVPAGFSPPGVATTASSPTKLPTAAGLENQGGAPRDADHDFQTRVPPSPANLPMYSSVSGVAAVWSGCEAEAEGDRRRRGGFPCLSGTFVAR